jgi:hypothetical protein
MTTVPEAQGFLEYASKRSKALLLRIQIIDDWAENFVFDKVPILRVNQGRRHTCYSKQCPEIVFFPEDFYDRIFKRCDNALVEVRRHNLILSALPKCLQISWVPTSRGPLSILIEGSRAERVVPTPAVST